MLKTTVCHPIKVRTECRNRRGKINSAILISGVFVEAPHSPSIGKHAFRRRKLTPSGIFLYTEATFGEMLFALQRLVRKGPPPMPAASIGIHAFSSKDPRSVHRRFNRRL